MVNFSLSSTPYPRYCLKAKLFTLMLRLLLLCITLSISTSHSENLSKTSELFYDSTTFDSSNSIHSPVYIKDPKYKEDGFYTIKAAVINQKVAVPISVSTDSSKETLYLALSTRDEGFYLFDSEAPFCNSNDSSTNSFELQYNNHCFNATNSTNTYWCASQLICNLNQLCTDCLEVELTQESLEYSTFECDGYRFNDNRIQGEGYFLIDSNDKNIFFNSKYPFSLITSMNSFSSWPSLTHLDGIWGISGPEICVRGKSAWYEIMNNYNSIFGIDSYIPLQQRAENNLTEPYALLHLGNNYFPYGNISWSERKQTSESFTDAMYRFTIYNIEMCGINLIDDFTSSWEVEIDTSSQCLVLPEPLYSNFMSWAPVDTSNCLNPDNTNSNQSVESPTFCPLSTLQNLPTFSFTLKEFSKDPIYINLEDLVFYDDNLQTEALCVVQLKTKEENYSISNHTIRFGLSVINNIYPVMDLKNSRVGLSQKPNRKDYFKQSKPVCAAATTCIGQQSFKSSSNSCVDPICSSYFFMTLNLETRECQIAPYAFPLLMSILTVLSLSELMIFLLYSRLIKLAASRSK